MGLQKSIYGSRIYAAIKGVKDSGVNVRVSDDVFPAEQRLSGEHLTAKDAAKIALATKKKIEEIKQRRWQNNKIEEIKEDGIETEYRDQMVKLSTGQKYKGTWIKGKNIMHGIGELIRADGNFYYG